MTHDTTWVGPEDMMLSRISGTQKDRHSRAHSRGPLRGQTQKVDEWGGGWGRGGSECFMGTESWFGEMESPGHVGDDCIIVWICLCQ